MIHRDRMEWLDALRLIAGVSVICMHASFDWNGQIFPDVTAAERTVPTLLRTIFYLARTELFLVISLFLLAMSLDKRPRGYIETIGQQARRLLIPYVSWMIIFVIFNLFKAWELGYLVYLWRDMTTIPDTWIRWFALGSIRQQMHFLPTLFALVLMYPLFQLAVRNPVLGLLILPCLFLKRELSIWIYENVDAFYVDYWLRLVRILTYSSYGFIGASFYGILRNPPNFKIRRLLLIGCFAIGIWALWVKFNVASVEIASGQRAYLYPSRNWANLLFPVVLFAVVMLRPMRFPVCISKLAPFSFGIFLCHPIFLDLFQIYVGNQIINPIHYLSLKIGFAVSMSFFLVVILSRTAATAWLVGLGTVPKFTLFKVFSRLRAPSTS